MPEDNSTKVITFFGIDRRFAQGVLGYLPFYGVFKMTSK
jgi:hypothetical protein